MVDLGLAGIAELVRIQNATLESVGIEREKLFLR
jgi:hypothetical protein